MSETAQLPADLFGLMFSGLYDAQGRDVDGSGEVLDLEGDGLFIQMVLRPESAVLGHAGATFADLAFIWLMPPITDALPVPEHVLGRIVAALDAGRVVAVRARDRVAIEAVQAAVLPLVGGARA